jgi:hypothetical protein
LFFPDWLKDELAIAYLAGKAALAGLEDTKKHFESMDLDHDGFVSAAEVEHVCKKFMSPQAAKELINEVDENGDGRIAFSEWLKAIHSVAGRSYVSPKSIPDLDSSSTKLPQQQQQPGKKNSGDITTAVINSSNNSKSNSKPQLRHGSSNSNLTSQALSSAVSAPIVTANGVQTEVKAGEEQQKRPDLKIQTSLKPQRMPSDQSAAITRFHSDQSNRSVSMQRTNSNSNSSSESKPDMKRAKSWRKKRRHKQGKAKSRSQTTINREPSSVMFHNENAAAEPPAKV